MRRSHEIHTVTCLLHLESIYFLSENGDFTNKRLMMSLEVSVREESSL